MKDIYVYADWEDMPQPSLMGVLSVDILRGKEVFSFEYQEEWLKKGYAQVIDPDLQLFRGAQFLGDENKPNFGVFSDSSPDRWGRLLMQRREAALAKEEKRRPRLLYEHDYLLGVYDKHRIGGIRFKTEPEGDFLDNDERSASPPWVSLRNLEEVSLKLEETDAMENPEYSDLLKLLTAPGSFLGGARPKASTSIEDPKGGLWIAKFPR